MSSASRKSQVKTVAGCAVAMRALIAIAIMSLADAFQNCNEFCNLVSRGYVNAMCSPECLCSLKNELSQQTLDIIVESSNVERTPSLDDRPIFYEPAEIYPYDISLVEQPIFSLPPTLKRNVILNPVNKKLKQSGMSHKFEFPHSNKIKTKESAVRKVDDDTKKLPMYLDIGVQKMENNQRPTQNDFKGIQNLQELEQSFKECIDLHIIINSRKDGSNNYFTNVFYDHKIDKYSSLSDSDLMVRIKRKCELPIRLIDESFGEIRRSVPKKSIERLTQNESRSKSYIENILQSRQQNDKKKIAVQDLKLIENSFQRPYTTEQRDSSIDNIKNMEIDQILDITRNYNDLTHSQPLANGELYEMSSTPGEEKIVNQNQIGKEIKEYTNKISTIVHPMSTFEVKYSNTVTISPQSQQTLATNFNDTKEILKNIDFVNSFETTVESNTNKSSFTISNEISDNATNENLSNTEAVSSQMQHTSASNINETKETTTIDFVNSIESTVESNINNSFSNISDEISANTTEKINTLQYIMSIEDMEEMRRDDVTLEGINSSTKNIKNYYKNSTVTEQTNVLLSSYKNNINTNTESPIQTISTSKNNDLKKVSDSLLSLDSDIGRTEYDVENDMLHETNIIDYFTSLESMGTKNGTVSSELDHVTIPNEPHLPRHDHFEYRIGDATTESTSINKVNENKVMPQTVLTKYTIQNSSDTNETLWVTTNNESDTTSSGCTRSQYQQEKIEGIITNTPCHTMRVEYIENELAMPTIKTREFTNETVVTQINGMDTIANNIENITNIATLQTTPITISAVKKREEEEVVGDLYIVFKKYYIPARFIQDAKGKIKLGIDGATLCEKIAQKGLNDSLMLSALCNCSQSKNCTNNVLKDLS